MLFLVLAILFPLINFTSCKKESYSSTNKDKIIYNNLSANHSNDMVDVGLSHLVAYGFENVIEENINDNEHNRYIKILQINSDSIWNDQINAMIKDTPMSEYNEYLKKIEWKHNELRIETEYWEIDSILYICSSVFEASTYTHPVIVCSCALDLISDILYDMEDVLSINGIVKEHLLTELNEYKEGPWTLKGFFFRNNHLYIIADYTYPIDGSIITDESFVYDSQNKTIKTFISMYSSNP